MTLSVVIPAFNAETTLDVALASAVESDLVGEVVVVDDGSVDLTFQIALAWSRRSPKVQCISTSNGGTAAARLAGIHRVSSQWVLFLDADDILIASGLGALWRRVQEVGPETVVLGGLARYLSADGQRRGGPTRQEFYPVNLEQLLRARIAPWPPASAIVRSVDAKKALEAVLAGSRRSAYPEDYAFLVELLTCNGLAELCTEMVSYVRVSDKSKTAGITSSTFLEAHNYAAERWSTVMGTDYPEGVPSNSRSIDLRRAIIRHLTNGRRVKAFGCFLALSAVDPQVMLKRLVIRIRRRSDDVNI